MTPIAIPTPTPFPSPVATTVMIDSINPSDITRQIAMEGVQWWNVINQNDIISYVQLGVLMLIIIAGIVLITSALNGDSDDV